MGVGCGMIGCLELEVGMFDSQRGEVGRLVVVTWAKGGVTQVTQPPDKAEKLA